MKDILVLLDTGAEIDTRGLEHGLELARTEGATLHVLVAPVAGPSRRDRGADASPAAAIEAALADLETDDVDVNRFEVTSGRPHRAVRSYALAHDVDLVVLGPESGRPGARAHRESLAREVKGVRDDVALLSM